MKLEQTKATKNATNIVELRESLLGAYNDLRQGKCDPKDVVELNNTVGKIIASCAVQLGYAALRRESIYISFLQGETQPADAKLAPQKLTHIGKLTQ